MLKSPMNERRRSGRSDSPINTLTFIGATVGAGVPILADQRPSVAVIGLVIGGTLVGVFQHRHAFYEDGKRTKKKNK